MTNPTATIFVPYHALMRRHVAIFSFDFSSSLAAPPTSSQVRIDAAYPYTAATKVWIRLISNEGRDVYWGLVTTDVGAGLVIQDKNDHTIFARFAFTGPAVDHTTYIEWPVTHVDHGGAALFNNQAVLVLKE